MGPLTVKKITLEIAPPLSLSGGAHAEMSVRFRCEVGGKMVWREWRKEIPSIPALEEEAWAHAQRAIAGTFPPKADPDPSIHDVKRDLVDRPAPKNAEPWGCFSCGKPGFVAHCAECRVRHDGAYLP